MVPKYCSRICSTCREFLLFVRFGDSLEPINFVKMIDDLHKEAVRP